MRKSERGYCRVVRKLGLLKCGGVRRKAGVRKLGVGAGGTAPPRAGGAESGATLVPRKQEGMPSPLLSPLPLCSPLCSPLQTFVILREFCVAAA